MKCNFFLLSLTFFASCSVQAEDFSFDASEFEKKTFEYSGYLEQKEEGLRLRDNHPAYQLAYPESDARRYLLGNTTTLDVTGKLNLEPIVIDARAQASYADDSLDSRRNKGRIMEGGVRWSMGPGLSFDMGKRIQRWGKGYAWNPVGLVERPKDSSDPQASREGFVMASEEWTKSLNGSISTVSLTGLVVPTKHDLNNDYGSSPHMNPAMKLYLLALDTDIDLMWRGKGAKPQSFGIDFSKNIGTVLEVHGEWARTLSARRNIVSSNGHLSSNEENYNSWLLGFRYLTSGETTWIVEYYRNGSGYGASEMQDYYDFLDASLISNPSQASVNKARTIAQSGYGRPNSGRDYLYVKASVNEPFRWVYSSASLTTMFNLNDQSWQITPELTYTGFSNVEIRTRVLLLGGREQSEFGEKTADRRIEIYARFFF